ncbi:MAG TPA: MarR family transcriptional regulator [Streptosporangiaceae bacterium]|jgi:DNA-binding MarR family transcriptional regulator
MTTSPPDAAVDLGVVDGLVQLSFVVQSLLGRVAARHDLSTVQARLLGVLRDREIGMLALARILELEKSSVTGLVDRAERRGLVQRVPVPGNRRAVHVTLSPHGHALAAAVAAEVAADVRGLIASISGAQQQQLSRLASRLITADAAARSIAL